MEFLTQSQKGVVCDIALEAYAAWPDRAEWEIKNPGVNGATAWRHAEQEKAVGHRSLRNCSDADYRPLQLHFMRLRAKHQADSKNLTLF